MSESDIADFLGEISLQTFRLVWTDTSLQEGIANGNERVMQKIRAVMEYKAPEVENYMKSNAPWQDQTGNARQGLRATAFQEGTNAGIVLYHTVP